MTNVTNTSKQPLGLPSGILVPPGATVAVPNWASDASNRVVQAWLRNGILRADAPAAKPDAGGKGGKAKPDAGGDSSDESEDGGEGEGEGEGEADEKGLLIAELAALGITKNRRSSVETLQAALAEAKANAGK